MQRGARIDSSRQRNGTANARQMFGSTERGARALLTLVLLTTVACQSAVIVGSGCKDGVCPLVVGADACVLRAMTFGVLVDSDHADLRFPGLCMPVAVARDAQGLVDLHVVWVFPSQPDAPSGTPSGCSERAFLRDVSPALTARFQASRPNQVLCEIQQLPVSTATAERTAPDGEGFYYDDFSSDLSRACTHPNVAIAFTDTAKPPVGVEVWVLGTETLDPNGEPRSGDVCRAVADDTRLGVSCVPSLAQYYVSQTVLETRVAACGGAACLAYHLNGSLADDCRVGEACPKGGCLNDMCIEPDRLAKEAFCTCRCDAPDKSAELCTCAHGFSCVPLFDQGDPSLVGSYCVRDELVSLP